jgi:hypothetical protein
LISRHRGWHYSNPALFHKAILSDFDSASRTRKKHNAMSKNAVIVNQLKLACRHVEEMIAAGVTENLAIRTLELFADMYAKFKVIGNTSPHHVNRQVVVN